MTPQRTHANDDGTDWQAFWDQHIQQFGPRRPVTAANDNEDDRSEREPSRFWVALALIFVVAVGFAAIGSIQS
ncbi:hypothetical protein [Brevundimonas sp. FT23028]|uniref:hypothetical protein n=1 Tax=Brevundimonas sp. FT23028 TaxID=3393748 RepID=UPI003B5884CE